MRFPLPPTAVLLLAVSAVLVSAPPAAHAQEDPVVGVYDLTFVPVDIIETDVDRFVSIDVDATARNASTSGYEPALVCYPYRVSYAQVTASAADVWVTSGTDPTAAGGTIGWVSVAADGDGGGAGAVYGLVVAGDALVEPVEFFDLFLGSPTRHTDGTSTCGAAPASVTGFHARARFRILDDDQDDDEDDPSDGVPVAAGYSLALQPTAIDETDVDVLVRIDVTAAAVEESEAGYVPGLLCYPYRLSHAQTSAGPDDVWVVAGDDPGGVRGVFGWVSVVVDAGGGGVGFVHGLVVAGDDLVEAEEFFDLVLGPPSRADASASSCGSIPPVAVEGLHSRHRLSIVDDDGADPEGPVETADIVVNETDRDYVAVITLTAGSEPGPTCVPYVLAFGAGLASAADAALVESLSNPQPVSSGWFLFDPGSVFGVSRNLLVVGDDLAEGDEEFVLRLYARQSVAAGQASCLPQGAPVFDQIVLIEDDDAPPVIDTVDIDSAVDGTVFEGDPGDSPTPVYLLVTFSAVLTEALDLVYGSFPTGSANRRDIEFVSEDRSTVAPGVFGARVLVAHTVPDDLPEGAETFAAWVQVEGFPSTRTVVTVTVGNDDVVGDQLLDVRLVGYDGLSLPEGDPGFSRGRVNSDACRSDWHCVPVELSLSERQAEDVTYELNLLAGTADPHLDYVPLERVRLEHREGHLRTFDVSAPLRIEIRRDFVVEASETFYLVVHQVVAGGDVPMLSWFEQITIVDDDGFAVDDAAAPELWFGTGLDAPTCPVPSSRLFPLREPSPDAGLAVHRLTLVLREFASEASAGADVTCAPADPGKPVDFHYDLLSDSGQVGTDVALVGSKAGDHVRFLNGVANVDVFVFSDALLEPVETVVLQLYSGAGPAVAYTLVVADYETTHELAASQLASAARYGRLLAAEASDALADRFSCAAADLCSGPPRDGSAALWPRRPAPSSGPMLFQRFLNGLASAGLASSSAGVVPGLPRSAAAASPLAFASAAEPAPLLHPLRALGPALEGARFQGDPGRWLGGRRFGDSGSGPSPWAFWARAGYAEAFDQGSTGRSLRTSLLSFTGGLDRRVGRLRVGWLHSYVVGMDEVAVHESARPFVPDLPSRSTSWHMTGPYIGALPLPRLRLWLAPLWMIGSAADSSFLQPLSADAGSLSMRSVVGGGSVSLVQSAPFALDLEADFFSVAVGGAASLPVPDLELPRGAADRRRLAFRFGLPLGNPSTSRSRLTLRVARRWDSGTDLDWVWGGVRPYAGWVGAGAVSATDLVADYRHRRRGSSLSLAVTAGFQFEAETPYYPPAVGEHDVSPLSRRLRLAAVVGWGDAGRPAGWTARVRPAYGRPSVGLPGWWDSASFGRVAALPSVPLLDGEVGYVFPDRSRLVLAAQRAFGTPYRVPSGDGSLLSALLRFVRSW